MTILAALNFSGEVLYHGIEYAHDRTAGDLPRSRAGDQEAFPEASPVYSLAVLFQPANTNGGLLQNWVEVPSFDSRRHCVLPTA